MNRKIVKVKIVPEAKAAQTISAFTVSESVTFTILNGLLGGSGKDADNRAIEANGGTVILKDTILAGFQALSGNGGAVWMNGGTLEAEKCNFGYFTREDNNYKEYSGREISPRAEVLSILLRQQSKWRSVICFITVRLI